MRRYSVSEVHDATTTRYQLLVREGKRDPPTFHLPTSTLPYTSRLQFENTAALPG